MRDKYLQKVKKPPQAMVHTTNSKLPKGYMLQPDNIIFTQANATWVHPHEDTLVITTEVANSLVHRFLVDSRSVVNILYWGAY